MMADPARIKVEDAADRPTSANELKIDVKPDSVNAAATASADENKELSLQEQPKQEQNSVSLYHKHCTG